MLLRAAVVVVAATVLVLLVTTRRTDDDEHTSCTRLAVPAYVEPAELVRAGDGEATTVMILNPADGPDVERDEELVPAVRAVRGDGVLVLGYIATGYGAIAVDEVVAQARRYERWYGVDGIFLDEVSSEAADLAHYDGMAASLRAEGVSTVAINPGVYPDPGYLDVADLVVTFEGTAQEYRDLERPTGIGAFAGEWLSSTPRHGGRRSMPSHWRTGAASRTSTPPIAPVPGTRGTRCHRGSRRSPQRRSPPADHSAFEHQLAAGRHPNPRHPLARVDGAVGTRHRDLELDRGPNVELARFEPPLDGAVGDGRRPDGESP